MKTANFIIIHHKNKKYSVNIEKLNFVISSLEGKKVIIKDENDAKVYFEKYELYDEIFLNNIDKI